MLVECSAMLQQEDLQGTVFLGSHVFAKGSEVYDSYGAQNNARLIQDYGFTVAGNPHDTCSTTKAFTRGKREELWESGVIRNPKLSLENCKEGKYQYLVKKK